MVEFLVLNTTLCYSLSFRMSLPGDLLPHREIRLTEDPRASGGGGREKHLCSNLHKSHFGVLILLVVPILWCSDVLESPVMITLNDADPY